MGAVTPSPVPGQRDRTRTAILEAAAAVFAEQGPGGRLLDVAQRAGVGEATLYRYFSNRHSLLAALYEYAVDESFRVIEAADLPNVPVPEGIVRVVRAFVALQSKFAVLVRMGDQFRDEDVERRMTEPFEDLFRRGAEEGVIHTEFTGYELGHMLGGVIRAASELQATGKVPLERAAHLASATFLRGILATPVDGR